MTTSVGAAVPISIFTFSAVLDGIAGALYVPQVGIINPGEFAVVQFDMQVNVGVPPGTLITNQATVFAAEVPFTLTDGDVVIAAITSCTNTSNPGVMLLAGLLAKEPLMVSLHHSD